MCVLRSLLGDFAEDILGRLAVATVLINSSASQALQKWKEEVTEAVTTAFAEQAMALFDTVKTMDNALQRRAKLTHNAATSDQLRDSDKIALQVQLDILAYGEDLQRLGLRRADFDKLKADIDDLVGQQLANK